MKYNTSISQLAELSLYAALIFLSIQVFRIPVGAQFIHFGNALIVVGVLLFGTYRGILSAIIGLAIFDLLNGYAAEIWIITLETVIVCAIIHFVYQGIFRSNDSSKNLVIIGIVAGLIKILLNLFKYTLVGILGGNLSFVASFMAAIFKIIGTFGSSLATIIAVPILYPILKRILQMRSTSSVRR